MGPPTDTSRDRSPGSAPWPSNSTRDSPYSDWVPGSLPEQSDSGAISSPAEPRNPAQLSIEPEMGRHCPSSWWSVDFVLADTRNSRRDASSVLAGMAWSMTLWRSTWAITEGAPATAACLVHSQRRGVPEPDAPAEAPRPPSRTLGGGRPHAMPRRRLQRARGGSCKAVERSVWVGGGQAPVVWLAKWPPKWLTPQPGHRAPGPVRAGPVNGGASRAHPLRPDVTGGSVR